MTEMCCDAAKANWFQRGEMLWDNPARVNSPERC